MLKFADNQKGFTLSEVLITMAVVGIFFSALGGLYAEQYKLSDKVNNRAFLQQDIRHAMSLISKDIREAQEVIVSTNSVSITDSEGNTRTYVLDGNTITLNGSNITSDSKILSFSVDDTSSYIITIEGSKGNEEFTLTKKVSQRIVGFK